MLDTTRAPLLPASSSYVRLDNWLNRGHFDAATAYPLGATKEARRAEIAESIMKEIVTVAPSRLLALVGQAVKWQQHMVSGSVGGTNVELQGLVWHCIRDP